METEAFSCVLEENGFSRLNVNSAGIDIHYAKQDEEIYVLMQVKMAAGDEFGTEQLLNIRRQLINHFETKGYIQIHPLVLIISDNTGVHLKKYCDEINGCWIADTGNRRLIIYENQPAAFGVVKELLETVLYRKTDGQKKESRGIQGRKVGICNLILVVLNAIIFVGMDLIFPDSVTDIFNAAGLFWPSVVYEGEYYRLLTYMFLHSGAEHLINNMIVLLFIGDNVEKVFGKWRYLLVYFSSGILAGIVSIVYNMNRSEFVLSVGASGAGFGIIGAFACVLALSRGRIESMSLQRILLFIALSLYGGFTSRGIDNAAHIGGLVVGAGVAAILWLTRRRRNEN